MSLGDAAARGTAITLLSQGARLLLLFGTTIVLTRLLTPADFGLVAMVTAIVGLAELVRDFGLSAAAIQAREISSAERTNLFWANLALGGICAMAAFAAAPLIGVAYGDSRLVPIASVLAFVFLLNGASTQFRAELTRELRFGALAAVDLLPLFAGVCAAVFLALSGAGYWAIVAQQVSVAVVGLILVSTVCKWRPGLPQRKVSIRHFMRFGGSLLGTRLLAYIPYNVDTFGIGAVLGPSALGFYNRSYQLVVMPINQINVPMTRVALPVLSRVHDDHRRYNSYLRRAQLVSCYLTASVFGLMAAASEPLIEVLFGERWLPAAPLLTLLAIGGAFRSVSQISYWIYVSSGKTGHQFRFYLVTQPLMAVVILSGLFWGASGVAAGYALAFFMFWIASLWWVGRVTSVNSKALFLDALRVLGVVVVPMSGLAWLANTFPWPPVLQLVAAFFIAAAYIGALVIIVPSVRRDGRMVADFLLRMRRRGSS